MSIELNPKGQKYKFLLEAVRDRKRYSANKMKQYHNTWNNLDDQFSAYIPTREVEEGRKENKMYKGDVDYVTLELPYTYATLMSAHTYWSTVFLSRNPVYQVSGRHGESQEQVLAAEAIMDYQKTVGEHVVPLFNWIFDMAKYGVGFIGYYWDKEVIQVASIEEQEELLYGMPTGKFKKKKITRLMDGYEGNRLYPIRIYDAYPDPRHPIGQFQKGEFFGRDVTVGWHDLEEGDFQNLDLIRQGSGKDSNRPVGSPRIELPYSLEENGGDNYTAYKGEPTVDLHEMTIRLQPSKWGLGSSDRIEKWVFTVANDEVLTKVEPLGYFHNNFPVRVMEGMYGHDAFLKKSMSEMMKPMTDIMTWLVNSHFYNVRRAINGQTIIDQSKVNVGDLKHQREYIRVKDEMMGQDIRTVAHRLDIPDRTQSNLMNTQYVEQMMQKVTGVMDNIMGQLATGGRKTATEVRTAGAYSASRLKSIAEYNSALAFGPLVADMIQNTQQLMDKSKQYRIAGNNAIPGQSSFIEVEPEMIAGMYDYVPVDGTLPIDRLAQATFWKELIVQLARSPLAMEWDLNGMVSYIMHLQGERQVDRFRIQPKMRDPEELQNEERKGNVVRIPSGGSGSTGSSGNPTGVSKAR